MSKKQKLATDVSPTNFDKWLEANKDSLKPPVCNKLMYGGQLKIMFSGGKDGNERGDYHLEDGEELFYQIKGDMVLKVIEKGQKKDIKIREGEMFLLPPRVPHSPQRTPNTVGLVVERDRREGETDGLRWYVEGTTQVLWEKFFHCFDLGSQLGPVISEFKASEASASGQPNATDGTVLSPEELPVTLDEKVALPAAQHFAEWLGQNEEKVDFARGVDLFKGDDFRVTIFKGPGQCPERFSWQKHDASEVYIYQMEGSSTLTLEGGKPVPLGPADMLILEAGQSHRIEHHENSTQLQLTWWSA